MAVTKATLFDEKGKRMAEFSRVLGHPARIAILKHLSLGKCVCGHITRELPLAQSTVSQHLKALKGTGLIRSEIDGVKVCYCLDPEAIAEAGMLLDELFEMLNSNQNC